MTHRLPAREGEREIDSQPKLLPKLLVNYKRDARFPKWSKPEREQERVREGGEFTYLKVDTASVLQID